MLMKITPNISTTPDGLDCLAPQIEYHLYWLGTASAIRRTVETLLDRAQTPPARLGPGTFEDARRCLNRLVDAAEALPDGEARERCETALGEALEAFRTMAGGYRLERPQLSRLRRALGRAVFVEVTNGDGGPIGLRVNAA